jgi:hypothetical protein
MIDEYAKAIAAEIKKLAKDGKRVIIETSNETFRLDLETGEMVSTSYVNEIWNYPLDGGGNVG